jgi:hypothetical protein
VPELKEGIQLIYATSLPYLGWVILIANDATNALLEERTIRGLVDLQVTTLDFGNAMTIRIDSLATQSLRRPPDINLVLDQAGSTP